MRGGLPNEPFGLQGMSSRAERSSSVAYERRAVVFLRPVDFFLAVVFLRAVDFLPLEVFLRLLEFDPEDLVD